MFHTNQLSPANGRLPALHLTWLFYGQAEAARPPPRPLLPHVEPILKTFPVPRFVLTPGGGVTKGTGDMKKSNTTSFCIFLRLSYQTFCKGGKKTLLRFCIPVWGSEKRDIKSFDALIMIKSLEGHMPDTPQGCPARDLGWL